MPGPRFIDKVILGHAIAELGLVGFSNPADVMPPAGVTHTIFPGQLFFSSRLAVDTFLLLAGFLLTLGAQKRLRELGLLSTSTGSSSSSSAIITTTAPTPTATGHAGGSGGRGGGGGGWACARALRRAAWVPAFAANRVLRILPLYAACLLFWWHVAPRLGSGPFWFAWNG